MYGPPTKYDALWGALRYLPRSKTREIQISRGTKVPSAAALATVRAYEDQKLAKYLPVEQGACFDTTSGALLFEVTGTKYFINPDKQQQGLAVGNIFTHNHTTIQAVNALGKPLVLSGADLSFASGVDLAQMRAVSIGWTSVASRPQQGWPTTAALLTVAGDGFSSLPEALRTKLEKEFELVYPKAKAEAEIAAAIGLSAEELRQLEKDFQTGKITQEQIRDLLADKSENAKATAVGIAVKVAIAQSAVLVNLLSPEQMVAFNQVGLNAAADKFGIGVQLEPQTTKPPQPKPTPPQPKPTPQPPQPTQPPQPKPRPQQPQSGSGGGVLLLAAAAAFLLLRKKH